MKYLGQIVDDNDLVNKKYVDDSIEQEKIDAGHNLELVSNTMTQTNSYVHSGSTPPADSIDGDLWFDPEDNTIVNEFQSPINLVTGATMPEGQGVGDLWLDTGSNSILSEKAPELIIEIKMTEKIKTISQDMDFKNYHNLLFMIRGKKNDTTTSITEWMVYRSGKRHYLGYYSAFLGATMAAYPYGSEFIRLEDIGDGRTVVMGWVDSTGGFANADTFQVGSAGNAGSLTIGARSYVTTTRADGFYLNLSQEVEEIWIRVYGF